MARHMLQLTASASTTCIGSQRQASGHKQGLNPQQVMLASSVWHTNCTLLLYRQERIPNSHSWKFTNFSQNCFWLHEALAYMSHRVAATKSDASHLT